MASRKKAPLPPEPPQVDPTTGIRLLRSQIEKGRAVLGARPIDKNAYSSWELMTRNCLEKAFGAGSPNVSSIMDVGKYGSFPMGSDPEWWDNHRAESLKAQLSKLNALVELLETEIEIDGGTKPPMAHEPNGHAIFLVHGHDDAVLHDAARFLERLQQEVVILRELPNKGRTIIEKFEDYSSVGFAVVLLTADDLGGPVAVPFDQQKQRARQNVILELGYFLGKLGRNRVCALYRPGVEIPSDYTGVLYVALDDAGAWRFALAKELKAAGFQVDMNHAV
jgi:predicted nucleotide-binding protein